MWRQPFTSQKVDLRKHDASVHYNDNMCKLSHEQFDHLHYGVPPLLKDMMQGLLNFKIKETRVCKGNFQAMRTNQGRFLIWFIRMCVNRWLQLLWRVVGTLSLLLMITLIRLRIILWRLRMKYSVSSENSKPWMRIKQGRKIKVLEIWKWRSVYLQGFGAFCREERWELTVPYNTQQNGVEQMKNQSIIGTTKAMIHYMDLQMSLWAETCNTADYSLKICPYNILKDKMYLSFLLEIETFDFTLEKKKPSILVPDNGNESLWHVHLGAEKVTNFPYEIWIMLVMPFLHYLYFKIRTRPSLHKHIMLNPLRNTKPVLISIECNSPCKAAMNCVKYFCID